MVAAPSCSTSETTRPRSTNRAAEEGPRVEKMRAALRVALTAMAPAGDRARTAAVGPEQVAILRSLGYVGGSGGGGELDQPGLPDPRDRIDLYERLQALSHPQNIPLDRATVEAAEIARQDPDNPFAHDTVASLAYRAGRLGEAARAFRRALDLDPDRPAVRQNYGRLLRDMDRLDDSEKELRLAVAQTDTDDARTRASLALTLVLVGKTTGGRRARGREPLRIEPNDPEALVARARVKAAKGKTEEAVASFRAAAAGGEPDARIELALALLHMGTWPARDPKPPPF